MDIINIINMRILRCNDPTSSNEVIISYLVKTVSDVTPTDSVITGYLLHRLCLLMVVISRGEVILDPLPFTPVQESPV